MGSLAEAHPGRVGLCEPLTGTRYKHRFTLIRNICQQAGVPHYTCHCIRHFVASFLYDKKKVSLPVISKLLRHKSLQTTEIYLQAIDPSFRETMRLLEGQCQQSIGRRIKRGKRKPTSLPLAGLPKEKGFKVLYLKPLILLGAEAGIALIG